MVRCVGLWYASQELASCCVREVVVVDVSNTPLSAAQRLVVLSCIDTSLCVCRSLKVEKPDVVVGTPSKLLAQLQNKVNKQYSIYCQGGGGGIPCVYPWLTSTSHTEPELERKYGNTGSG